ncbi:hypothetical protein Tco_1430348 [Tanacetum coccineum]
MDWLSKRKFVIVCHEKLVRIPLEGDEILWVHGERRANVVIDALRRKERVKPRRVRAMAMTIQYGVRGMILAAQSEAFKQENVLVERLHGFRWMIYLVVLADAAESDSDAIRFEYCLASSSGWTKSPVIWAEIGGSSLIGPELVQEMTNKVVLVKEKPKAARDRQKSYVDNRRKPLELEGKLAPRLVKSLVLTYEYVVMYGLCVYMRYVDYVRVGNQSIERDRLTGIGLVMDLVKFLSFTFGGKEMTFVVLAFFG